MLLTLTTAANTWHQLRSVIPWPTFSIDLGRKFLAKIGEETMN